MTAMLRMVFGSSMRWSPRMQPFDAGRLVQPAAACRGGGHAPLRVCFIAGSLTAPMALGQSLTGAGDAGRRTAGPVVLLAGRRQLAGRKSGGPGVRQGLRGRFPAQRLLRQPVWRRERARPCLRRSPIALALGFDWLNQSLAKSPIQGESRRGDTVSNNLMRRSFSVSRFSPG